MRSSVCYWFSANLHGSVEDGNFSSSVPTTMSTGALFIGKVVYFYFTYLKHSLT